MSRDVASPGVGEGGDSEGAAWAARLRPGIPVFGDMIELI